MYSEIEAIHEGGAKPDADLAESPRPETLDVAIDTPDGLDDEANIHTEEGFLPSDIVVPEEPISRASLARLLGMSLSETKTITDALQRERGSLFKVREDDPIVRVKPEALPLVYSRYKGMQATSEQTEPTAGPEPAPDDQTPKVKLTKDPDSPQERERRVRSELHKRLRGFTDEIQQGDTLEAERFTMLVGLFGKEHAMDLLYQYRPEFKDKKFLMPVVKSFLGDYLGDVTIKPGELDVNHLQEAVPLLSNAKLKKALTGVFREHCLTHCSAIIKNNPAKDQFGIVADYIDDMRAQLKSLAAPELEEILEEVEDYYLSVFEIEKPAKFIAKLSEDRTFPDITQRITVKELGDKRRWLNGNGTGMGKSASAIMSKEILGTKCAVIVAPSGVVDREVWQEYLSAHDPETDKGYFIPGQEPRVLVVKNLECLQRVKSSDYDYIIISHGKINRAYTEALKAIDYDMLIVDEAHKFKNLLEGVRPELILELAEKIDGQPNKHLLVLTATAAPNKVEDIAMILRLLHPKRFRGDTNEQLIHRIIRGDLLDIRNLLTERMQNQRLEDFVNIEPANETMQWIELTEEQRIAYDVLLEEYELTPGEKLMALRLFCLNPAIFDPTPSLGGGKVAEFEKQLIELFKDNDKVLAFINDYVEDVLKGDKSIYEQIGLPEGVQAAQIHGKTSKHQRNLITDKFQNEDGKMLLTVSGQTVSVGVDLNRAGAVIIYNEPWTYPERMQQIGRPQRPGREGVLDILTMITRGTIEEGIYRYIRVKYNAIEKLMYGIPLSDIETGVVQAAEKGDDTEGILLVNKQLADNYYSNIDRMNMMFARVKDIGQASLLASGGFLEKHGEEYATNYQDLTNRSYQANVSRMTGTLVGRLLEDRPKNQKPPRILDIGSGPEMLRRHIADELVDRVLSVDINTEQLKGGSGHRATGVMAHLPVTSGSMDIANMALTLHYSGWSERDHNYERLHVISELNRVLKPGGTALITMPYSLDFQNQGSFFTAVKALGFTVVDDYSGQATSGDGFKAQVVVLRKVHDCPNDEPTLRKQLGHGMIEMLRIVKKDKKDKKEASLRDSRTIIRNFELNERLLPTIFNTEDQKTLDEEQAAIETMQSLQTEHGSIELIPPETVAMHGFARLFVNKRYILFRKLARGNGAAVIRDVA